MPKRLLAGLPSWLAAAGLACTAAVAQAVDLYQPNAYRALASDVKAYQLGDTLTVVVTENTTAITSADTSSGRNTAAGVDVKGHWQGNSHAVSLDGGLTNNFSGNAKTQRAGRLLAQITVTVTGVLPNGDLQVSGEQTLEINNEKQMLNLAGRVRRQDIAEGNTVPSNRIAEARIRYVGDGVLSDGQRASLVSRVLTWLGL